MIRLRDGDEERLLTLAEFERSARRGEISPLAWVCVPDERGEIFVQARTLELFTRIYDPRRFHFRKHFHVVRFPFFTLILAALCIGFFAWAAHLGGGAPTRGVLLKLGAKTSVRIIEEGETFRLLMANLLNRDWVHLSFNLIALLSVGTVLEGVYRRGDLLFLFISSGVFCMGISAVFTQSTTVGASGLVFGCLGAAGVFGWRYRDILPRRYRTFFGSVILSYTCLMFYLGVVNPSTDNWTHAGGLAVGIVFAFVVEPRLLRLKDSQESIFKRATPYAAALFIVVLLLGIGPLMPKLFFSWTHVDIDAFGVVLERPKHWQEVKGPMGFYAFGNQLDAFVSIGCKQRSEVSSLVGALERFHDELLELEESGSLSLMRIENPISTMIGVKDFGEVLAALKIRFQIQEQQGVFNANAFLFSRGQLECSLVQAKRPAASEGTQELLDYILAHVVLGKTHAQNESNARVALHQTEPEFWLELALANQIAGDSEGSRRAFLRAESLADGHESELLTRIGFARARFELSLGNDFSAAHQALSWALNTGGARRDLLLLEAEVFAHEGRFKKAYSTLKQLKKRFAKDEISLALIEERRTLLLQMQNNGVLNFSDEKNE